MDKQKSAFFVVTLCNAEKYKTGYFRRMLIDGANVTFAWGTEYTEPTHFATALAHAFSQIRKRGYALTKAREVNPKVPGTARFLMMFRTA